MGGSLIPLQDDCMNNGDILHKEERATARPSPLARPSKEEIAALPPFEGLQLSHIHVLKSKTQIEFATRALMDARFVGFDTETKPAFTKDAVRDGPHVVQFATLEHAFIVQVGMAGTHEFLRNVIESAHIVKVGFGLKSDRRPLRTKLGIRLDGAVDLAPVVRRLGYRQAVGVKAAVAIVLGQRLVKSKSVTTSNWALPKLRPNQLQYAADDALAALRVFHAMGQPYAPQSSRA